MSEHEVRPGEFPNAWPLTPFVRGQLAIASVWGSYAIGVLVLMAVAALLLLAGNPIQRVLDGPFVLSIAVALGAFVMARVMPKVWPAAWQISFARRLLACLLGPGTTMLLGVGARYVGMIPAKGSMDPTEGATILTCTLGGAAASWLLLQRSSHA